MTYTKIQKHVEIHQFADDTNLLLYSNKSLKDSNQKKSFELKNIDHCLRTNKVSLNTKKTEIVLFRAHRRKMDFEVSGQKNKYYERNKIFRNGNG